MFPLAFPVYHLCRCVQRCVVVFPVFLTPSLDESVSAVGKAYQQISGLWCPHQRDCVPVASCDIHMINEDQSMPQ
jgi:hypothetical protein